MAEKKPSSDPPVLGYPEKFELALRYGQGPLSSSASSTTTDSDRLLLDALSKQALHGACKEPRPSIFDAVARARHFAWVELGNRSTMEAMFMYVQAVEVLEPDWWRWPELGLVAETDDASAAAETADPLAAAAGLASPCANVTTRPSASSRPPSARGGAGHVRISPLDEFGSPSGAAATAAPAPAPAPAAAAGKPRQKLLVGGWTELEVEGAPARYRHSCSVVGARLFLYGGRSNTGRLATGLHVLDLLTGKWSAPAVGGTEPATRWGHSMNAYRQWVVLFGGHRGRGCLGDTAVLDTQSMAWAIPVLRGAPPPARGNHAAAVCMERLWLFGGDAPAGTLPMDVWSLPLRGVGESVTAAKGVTAGEGSGRPPEWERARVNGTPPPPCHDHTATTCGSRVLLLGGSSADGYVGLSTLSILNVDQLSWALVRTSGAVPRPRAGHGAAAVQTEARGWDVYLFGGGASAAGFDDLHVLDEAWNWKKLDGSPGESRGQRPAATEGAAVAVSGGMLLVCGGYTAAGATRACLAWGCESAPSGAAAGSRVVAERRGAGGRVASSPVKTLLLLSVPEHVPSQAHAQAAQAALMHGFTELQVVALNGGGAGSGPAGGETERSGGEATSQEQALAMLQHRLEALQLQWRALDGSSTSLLAQAQLVAGIQPCRYTLMAAGRPRAFGTVWIGLMDLATGRSSVAASASREVPAAVSSWGRAAAELDAESAVLVTQAWRALIKSW